MANLESDELHRRFDKALKIGGNTHTPADIADAVKEGKMQAWQNGQSVILTEVIGYPQTNVLNVVIAVGELDDVLAMLPQLYDFGRQHDCTSIRMQGRKGWAKVLPKYGWEQPNVTFERKL